MRPQLRFATMALAVAFALSACQAAAQSPSVGAPSSPGASTEATVAPPPSSSVDTSQLTIAVGGLGDQTWDPANSDSGPAAIKGAIGETLLRTNPQTRDLEPNLAESWTQTPDGLTTTFKLRADIPFHGGNGTLTAEDVKFTIEQYLGPTSDRGNQMQAIERAVDKNPAQNVEILGPLEFRITSPKFEVLLLRAFSNGSVANAMFIQSKKYWTEQAAQAILHPVGLGPFEFVSSTPGVEVQLKAVENHWRQTSTYKNVTFKVIPDDAARLSQVQSGAADLAVIPPSLAREAKNAGVNVVSSKDYAIMSVVLGGQHVGAPDLFDPTAPWIQADAPEKGLAIRQALDLAIDRPAILEAILAGEGTLTAGPQLNYPSLPSRSDPAWQLPTYDPEAAKAKLAEGGYPDGFTVKFPMYENRAGNGQADVGEAVAGYWEAIGITVERLPITDDQSDEYTRVPNLKGVTIVRFDPFMDESLQTLSCCYNPNGTHKLMFDPVFDDALLKLQSEPDAAKRADITREVIQYLIDTKKSLPLFTSNWTLAAGPKVGSWTNITGEGTINGLETITP
jgi:peptide/nickel transport system substrate-binding protein